METTFQQNAIETPAVNGASCGELQDCETGTCASKVNVGDLERAISVVVGGAFIIMAPSRTIKGCLMALTGVGLMYRAMTGHCFVYQNLGMNTAE